MKICLRSIALALLALCFCCLMPSSSSTSLPPVPQPDAGLQSTVPTTGETVPSATPTTTVLPDTVPSTAPPATQPAVPPELPLTASHAFVYRCRDEALLFSKGSMTGQIYPASITKLFTAYVALLYLPPDRQITVGDAIHTLPPDSSRAFLRIGDVLTTEQLLYGMLLPSGGDAARVVAAEAGRAVTGNQALSAQDAIAAFMAEVNRQATLVGMQDTHFVTPDGFHDPQHYTTMADLLVLAKLSIGHPILCRITATAAYQLTLPDRTLTWRNSNMLLSPDSPFPQFYRETAIGLKTGYTHTAGRCLLAAFLVDGELIFAGVFGCPDPNMDFIAQFENMCPLYDCLFGT